MLHVFETMNMENRKWVEWEQVPVHAMSRRIRAIEIRRKKKKTKRSLKVRDDERWLDVWHDTIFFLAEVIKVFDGNCSLRRRIFRAITVPRTCNLEQLLTTALRAFHIAREPNVRFLYLGDFERIFTDFYLQQFYLTDLYATNGDDVQIQDPTPVLNLHKIEGKRPAIFLRFR